IYQHWYDYAINVTIWDILGVLIIVGVVFLWAKQKASGKDKEAFYKYLPNAILIKVLAAIAFAVITMMFYPGDTFEYFKYVNRLNTMLFTNSGHYFDILLDGNIEEYWSYFTNETGFPARYMWRDPNAIFVPRIYAPLMIFTYKSFILSTIIASLIGFSGLWKLFIVFCKLYPRLEKKFAIAILYFPSILFWSSGLLKDTLTVAALGWIVYSFYNFAILYKFRIKYIVVIIICSIIIINIKSYIFAALLPGLLVWLFFKQLSSIKSGVIKFIVAPVLGVFIIVGFALLMSNLSGEMGAYGDVDKSLEQAKIIQEDLKRAEQYGENYYDIGEFEATPTGVLSKAPIAIISGIFRPFIWEARNPFVLLAALESLLMLGMIIFTFFKTGIIKSFRNVLQDPMLIFAFSFTIIFAFGVGLATANFGALVRYKIPMVPFFVAGLFILMEKGKKKVEEVSG
ncbi:MAG: hypothetical protein PHE56_02295, partial [Bacteroidales bacterium]|nr:hypothetical protein [Bacteroidales bacterium]